MGKQLSLTSFFGAPASAPVHQPPPTKPPDHDTAHQPHPPIRCPSFSNNENQDDAQEPPTVYNNTLSTFVALDQSSRIPTAADALGIAATPFQPPPGMPNTMCDYEQQRAARIARNREVLRTLGLEEEAHALARDMHAARQPKPPPKRRHPVEAVQVAVRRSTRSTAGVSRRDVSCAHGGGDATPPVVESVTPVEYVASSVVASYACSYGVTVGGGDRKPLCDATCVQLLRRRYECRTLSRIYSLDMKGTLLAAGGKGGIVALWGVDWSLGEMSGDADQDDDDNHVQPLMAAKLHGGWVADVQVLHQGGVQSQTGPDGNRILLLSASNDGWVALWDAGLVDARDGKPKCINRSNAIHSKGIFSLHAHACGGVLTAGKDGSVALTAIHPTDGIHAAPIRRWEDLHDGHIVKCARWRAHDDGCLDTTPHVFASCGSDGAVRIGDVRQHNAERPVVLADAAHSGMDVNCVRWAGGGAPERLLTTGFDHAIRVWDVRQPGTALHVFEGHIGVTRKPSIYQPTFAADGELVVTGGDGSECVSLYSVKTGDVVSRGAVDVGGDLSTLWGNVHGQMLGAVAGGGVVGFLLQ